MWKSVLQGLKAKPDEETILKPLYERQVCLSTRFWWHWKTYDNLLEDDPKKTYKELFNTVEKYLTQEKVKYNTAIETAAATTMSNATDTTTVATVAASVKVVMVDLLSC